MTSFGLSKEDMDARMAQLACTSSDDDDDTSHKPFDDCDASGRSVGSWCDTDDDDDENVDVDVDEKGRMATSDTIISATGSGTTFVRHAVRKLQDCASCVDTKSKIASQRRLSDAALAERALMCDFRNTMTTNNTCQASCSRSCMTMLSHATLVQHRLNFWLKVPSATDRRRLILDTLSEARRQYLREVSTTSLDPALYPNQFLFKADDMLEMCEQSYCNMLGLSTPEGFRSKMWIQCVNEFTGQTIDQKRIPLNNGNGMKKDNRKVKREHAYGYQKNIVESEIMDRSAYANFHNHLYLPYPDRRSFFNEYRHWCSKMNAPIRAEETTFRRAFKILEANKKKAGIHIRFSSGKGSFDKCEICHNADRLLKSRACSVWSDAEIEIIEAYRRQHILQQFDERLKLQQNIWDTHKLDTSGQPLHALIFGDGMTVYTGNTPREKTYGRGAKGSDSHITSRIIGVEVHCGPIHGTLLYYTDDLIGGGANTIIEVTRQAILDLQDLLSKEKDMSGNSLDMPRALVLQFDNCSENKNKFLFTYISLLIEKRIFDRIEVNFLIVGHTHASIDQYFSVLSKQILGRDYIGSPISLEHLLTNSKGESKMSGVQWKKKESGGDRYAKLAPLRVRKLVVFFDLKSSLKAILNPSIQYYPIPHL